MDVSKNRVPLGVRLQMVKKTKQTWLLSLQVKGRSNGQMTTGYWTILVEFAKNIQSLSDLLIVLNTQGLQFTSHFKVIVSVDKPWKH